MYERHECAYPAGDPREDDFRFCLKPRERGAYCMEHANLCYKKVWGRGKSTRVFSARSWKKPCVEAEMEEEERLQPSPPKPEETISPLEKERQDKVKEYNRKYYLKKKAQKEVSLQASRAACASARASSQDIPL